VAKITYKNGMKAKLDLGRNSPDYIIFLSKEEITELSAGKCILGYLQFLRGGQAKPEEKIILMTFLPQKRVRKIKDFIRKNGGYVYEGPHVTILRYPEVHQVFYTKESADDPATLLSQSSFGLGIENRFDSFTGNKIFLHYDREGL
jgi:hypothetical protein